MNVINLYTDKSKEYYSNTRQDIFSFVPSEIKHVLDVGCGSGYFGKFLKERLGCTVWGVEPDVDSALEAKQNIDNVLNCPFDRHIALQSQKFDCIFFNDVLEHLIDPYQTLKYAQELLLPNGYIISSIPNILHFFTIYNILKTQDWKYEDAGILDKTHIRFFTKKSIIRLHEDCGLKIINIQGINATYGKKYNILNFLLRNAIKDMRYIQFVTVAKK
ncbi:putative glycosyl transferase [Tolypothrix tenuis PCC 7101]|uniref:Putative glycosyl transferase n=1 Tax=Tolypothrix tenuis PCC 7101 TaxID=231146 RepID=A0A1Z4N809_9CYAN|nr:class I SAM-dependent methyltransferase [Aulosira sp. FACHB-113]BAZ01850.1 putative glycosyl transferase [Tolypothrix tenuis PCC 7101]BAZ74225.1 putative glycosyl transferase [Aulosira laxa NIES-50]